MAAATVLRSYVQLPDGQMHLRRYGAGSPVLMIHQSPSSGAMWEPLMPLLAQGGLHTLAPDLPGFGNSFGLLNPPSVEYYAATMLQLADALGLATFCVIGHHTGAAVALKMAAEQPSRIERLVLWGIPLLDNALRQRLLNEVAPSFDDEGEELARYWARRRKLSGDAFTPRLGVRNAIEMLQSGLSQPWAHWAVARLDVEDLLRSVGQPVLAMCGPADPLWPRSAEAAAMLPRGKFVSIAGAGLDVVDQCPSALADLSLSFLLRDPDVDPA